MNSIIRALALAGIIGLGTVAGAQAQTRFYVGIGSPVAEAIPPCPGYGYVWTAGYYDAYGWVPGRWIYRGYDRDDGYRARVYFNQRFYDHDRDRDRRYDRDRDRDRRYDWNRDRHDHDRDHDHR